MTEYEVIGFQHRKDKNNRDVYNLYLRSPMESSPDCDGYIVKDQYFSSLYVSYLPRVGDIVNLIFEPGFQGIARLVDIRVVA